MIKYNDNTINDWDFGTSNLIKVYRNNAIVYYKLTTSGGTPEYKVCFAVVDDITQYQETEFEDVYDNATEKWYKLNNLNQYEEYGVYGSGRTTCEASRLPQGYTEVEYIENTSTAYINTEVLLYDSATNSYEIETKMSSTWGGGEFEYLLATEGTSAPYNGVELRWNTHYQSGGELQCESVPKNVTYSNIDNGDGTSAITISCTSTNATNNVPLSLFCGIWSSGPWRNGKGKIYDLKITKNDVLVRDLVPCKRDSDDKYGMYDIVNDVFYISPNNVNLTGGEPITPTVCVTTYNGKLTIDDGYEYEWNGSSWVNLGEVSGSTKTSGFTSSDIGDRINSGLTDGDYILISYYKSPSTTDPTKIMSFQYSGGRNYASNLSGNGITTITPSTVLDTAIWTLEATSSADTYYVKNVGNGEYWGYQTRNSSNSFYLVENASKTPILITPSCKENCFGFVEKKSNVSTLYGGYGLNQLNGYTYRLNWWDNTGSNPCGFFGTDENSDFVLYKMNASDAEYPKYYSEKSDPLDDLTFNTLEEAEAYAYANCVYVGMRATIDGDRYVFSGDSISGYEWVYIPL